MLKKHMKSCNVNIQDLVNYTKIGMELKDYTTEELRAEIKRRYSLVQAEKARVKRCRHCSHWGEISCFGEQPNKDLPLGVSRCCRFFKTKSGKYYRCHAASQLACEYFEEKG